MVLARRPRARRATYQDVIDAPAHMIAEIVHGELVLSPRPAPRHARASSMLGGQLTVPFDGKRGGPRRPGGWLILDEPELHLPDHQGEAHVLVPDLAGWRLERMPKLPDTAYFEVAPDWVCEVVSPSTVRQDRIHKMPLYAQNGVRWLWLVDPVNQTLEVFAQSEGRWTLLSTHDGTDKKLRAVPFGAVALDMRRWWPVEG